jgi:uncharacterized membrane protein
MKILLTFLSIFFLTSPFVSLAQVEVHKDEVEVLRGEVVEIIKEEERDVLGTETKGIYQEVELKILSSDKKGQKIKAQNDFLKLKVGDVVYVNHIVTMDGVDLWTVLEVDRRMYLLGLFLLFVVTSFVFAGSHGLKAVGALLISVFIILYGFLPSILSGVLQPFSLSIIFGVLILALTMFLTHGFNKTTSIALLGTAGGIICAGVLSFIAIPLLKLSGFSSDESVFLNFTQAGHLNMADLLLGSIIIGMLGILDDVAITQVSAVEEMYQLEPKIAFKDLFNKAYRIGKHHIGSLINTLSLAYVGASLPLLLLFSLSDTSPIILVNREVFATEITRTLLGSIGLILTVPITTFLAVYVVKRWGSVK